MGLSNEHFDIVRECLATALELEEAEVQLIDRNTTAADVEKWKSLTHIKLILELEGRFGLEFEDHEIVDLVSIESILQTVENKKR